MNTLKEGSKMNDFKDQLDKLADRTLDLARQLVLDRISGFEESKGVDSMLTDIAEDIESLKSTSKKM